MPWHLGEKAWCIHCKKDLLDTEKYAVINEWIYDGTKPVGNRLGNKAETHRICMDCYRKWSLTEGFPKPQKQVDWKNVQTGTLIEYKNRKGRWIEGKFISYTKNLATGYPVVAIDRDEFSQFLYISPSPKSIRLKK